MANEISVSYKIAISNNNYVYTHARNFNMDQEAASPGGGQPGVVVLDTTEPATGTFVNLVYDTSANQITEGIVEVENLETATAQHIDLYVGSTSSPQFFARVEAGEAFIFRAYPSIDYFGRANSAASRLRMTIQED